MLDFGATIFKRGNINWVKYLPVMTFCLLGCLSGCLIPPTKIYDLQMNPRVPEGRGDYYMDQIDSSFVFTKEGVVIKVKHLTDEALNGRFPPLFDGRHVNPYTHSAKDPELGYVPLRFTVFEVSVSNLTYAKVVFDPAKAVLKLDNGDEYRYYDPGRKGANPLGGNSFSKYYRTELGISGNEKELNLERMGVVYKTVYHRDRLVFKGDERSGLLVFDPLPEGNETAELLLQDFVLEFDASGNVERSIDIRFEFDSIQSVVTVTQ